MSLNSWLLASNAAFFALSSFALVASIAVFLLTRANDRAKDRELRLYQAEAARTVAVANATAETAKADAARANERAGEANEAASNASERAGRLEKEAAEARVEQARLRESNLRLEREIQPRAMAALSTSQQQMLAPFKDTKIAVRSYNMDPESATFGMQIISNLENHGVSARNDLLTEQAYGSLVFGIWIDGDNKGLVSALSQIFRENNMAVEEGQLPPKSPIKISGSLTPQPADVTIFVGAKLTKPLPQK